MKTRMVSGSLLALYFLFSATGVYAASSSAEYRQEMLEWRTAREERLRNPDGYLSQVGLEWLEQGENRLGSLENSTVRIAGGPQDWGIIHLDGDNLTYIPVAGAGILVDGKDVAEVVLQADIQGKPTRVSHGDISFYAINRESYALRIKDRHSPDLQAYHGVESYEIQEDWRINARFVPAAEGTTIEIGNVLGQTIETPVYGSVEFERDGEKINLLAMGDAQSTSLWFMFADRTSGRETYGSGRYLYSDGMPEGGRVIVDFNKAYNPPCAFNDYSTCTLPPQHNRMKIAVKAGEKKYHE